MVDPTGGRLRHASADTRRAHAARLAGKRDAQLVTAATAREPQEAVLEVAALEQAAQLVGDEPGQRATGLLEALEEGRQMLGDDAHQVRARGAARRVAFGSADAHCRPRCNGRARGRVRSSRALGRPYATAMSHGRDARAGR
jgi:hypothetical protein